MESSKLSKGNQCLILSKSIGLDKDGNFVADVNVNMLERM